MALDKPYLDVPGTTIFDAEQSRKGYWLNQFCMSLMKAENRERFKADQRGDPHAVDLREGFEVLDAEGAGTGETDAHVRSDLQSFQ